MNANELRINNWIQWGNTLRYFHQVAVVSDDNFIQCKDFAERSIEEFDGIPLNEQWTLELGFEQDPKMKGWFILNDCHVVFRDGIIFYAGSKRNSSIVNLKRLRYVHDLQNIFYAIRDEELKRKETAKITRL